MQPKLAAVGSDDPTGQRVATRDANFYALPFASQMIVWAMRKRMHALCGDDGRAGGAGADDVLAVFHMAEWGKLYSALLTVVDILLASERRADLRLHAVSCPCLAAHEAHVLNALAHLQQRMRQESVLSLCEVLSPSEVRLAMPQLETIVDDVDTQGPSFAYVDLSTLAERRPRGAAWTATRQNRHLH